MPQSNFTALAVRVHDESENQHEYESIHLNTNAVLTTHVKCEADCMSKVYVPDNFIPEEVRAYLAAWDAFYISKTSSPDGMELDTASLPASLDMFEPTRRLNDFAPPKRFYRTFWRSMARRVVESSNRAIQA